MHPQSEHARLKLSAVVITLNEERALPRCLESLAFADEILVVDSGSSDGTCAVAEQMGARVIHQEWLGYGRQKQFAVEQAEHDWVLCVDADEWVSEVLRASIMDTLKAPDCIAYEFPRCNRFLGRWLRHGEGYPDYNLRLYHRGHATWSDDPIHEHVVSERAACRLAGDLMHESEEGLEDYLQKQNRYTTLQARVLYSRGKRPSKLRALTSPLFRFIKFYLIRFGWRDGFPGLVHVSIGCLNSYMKNIKLMEMSGRADDHETPDRQE